MIYIALQNVSLLTRVLSCKFEKFNFVETLYINRLGSPVQVHHDSMKSLEIPPLEVFLGEVDTFCRVDTAAKCITFSHGSPV